jgi:uncharacterized protein YbcV (DUF1398 family)
MFTVEQIEAAHAKVKSGADFPKYIQEIKQLGVTGFTTYVTDSHTIYYGANGFNTQSAAQYAQLSIADQSNEAVFVKQLKIHQQGQTDYLRFCNDCAENGIEKWVVDLGNMTCIYYNLKAEALLTEQIPVV